MQPNRYRSLFWPMILIGVGLVWFLANLNLIPNFNPLGLLNLWPLLLIALGIDLLIGRRSALVGLLIGLITIGAAILLLVMSPRLGFGPQLTTDRFNEALNNAASATVEIQAAAQPVTLRALSDSPNLFEGVITHTGTIDFSVSGGADRRILLRQRSQEFGGFNFGNPVARWEIGLNPAVPLGLSYRGGSGSNQLDLSGLQLTELKLDGGSGSFDLSLPAASKPYAVRYHGGSGSLDIRLAENTDATLTLEGGSGSLSLTVPAHTALRVEVRDKGSGSVSVEAGATRISGSANGDKGVWETTGFAGAAHKVTIIAADLGSGSLSIH